MASRDCSIIATTYNQSRDLDLYLRSLASQEGSPSDFEVVIADDGSATDTREVIDRWRGEHFGERLVHVWHEDTGYRKAKILNSAIRKSQGRWLIFTDSDLLVHPLFVSDHRSAAAPRALFMGRRVDLGPRISEWIRRNPDQCFSQEFYLRVLASSWTADRTRGVNRAFRIASNRLAKRLGCMRVPDLLGSNFSMDRELLFEVNGFDESSEHYWGEDGDLFARLQHSGAQITGRKSFAVQFHLWHPLRKRNEDAEREYEKKLRDANYRVCRFGLSAPK